MTRTKLCDRKLPAYTKTEEALNTVSHFTGALFGIYALISCIIYGADTKNVWAVIGCAVYGGALILLYSVSTLYHGIKGEYAKKVMQIIDHCTIYMLIAGTYTPILFCSIRPVSSAWAWIIFGLEWGFALVAAVLTAIDLKKYSKFSMVCYIGMGWCIVLAAKTAISAIAFEGLMYLLAGGIAYTVGAVMYGIGKKHRYVHFIFHLFVLAGTFLQFICVRYFVI